MVLLLMLGIQERNVTANPSTKLLVLLHSIEGDLQILKQISFTQKHN